jgi:hypothetical protein
MCLIQFSVAAPHCGSNIFKHYQELPLVALQMQKMQTNTTPVFSLQSGAYNKSSLQTDNSTIKIKI